MNLETRFARYREGYATLWHEMQVRPSRRDVVRATAKKIIANKSRYMAVQEATGVPWFVIGLIHKMEGNLSFAKHLHNGDSLAKRTRRVPAGRPVKGNPPFTWEESAIDALRYDGLHKQTDWTVERIAFAFEKFNGFGYRRAGVPSPYLWSFSNHYSIGKYEFDGVYNPALISQQSGAMVVLKAMADVDTSIRLSVGAAPAGELSDETEILPRTPSPAGGVVRSRTIYGLAVAAVGWVVERVAAAYDFSAGALSLVNTAADHAESFMTPIVRVAGMIGAQLPWLGAAAIVLGLAIALHARLTHNAPRSAPSE